MMASGCRQGFLSPLDRVPSLVLALTIVFYGRGSANLLTGEVGGNVTFRCPVKPLKRIEMFYFQRGKEFVNGYYVSKDEIKWIKWPNTKVNRNESSVNMYNLNLSHSGEYTFHVKYEGDSNIAESTIILTVTAKYSKPTVTSVCREKNGPFCHVNCTSYSGFPKDQMTVRAVVGNTSSQIWKNVERSIVQNKSSMLYYSSSTAYYNCSSGEIKFSCSVGDVTSDELKVCAHPDHPNTAVIAAAVCLVVVVIVIAVVLYCRRRAGVNGQRVPTNDEVEIATVKEAA